MIIFCNFSGKDFLSITKDNDVIGYLVLLNKDGQIIKMITKFIAYSSFIERREELIEDIDLYFQAEEIKDRQYDALGFFPLYINAAHWENSSKCFNDIGGRDYIFKILLYERHDLYLIDTCQKIFYSIPEKTLDRYTNIFAKYTIYPECRLPQYISDNLDFLGMMFIAQLVGTVDKMISIHAQQFLTFLAEEEIRRNLDYRDLSFAKMLNVPYIKKTYGDDLEYNVPKNIEDIVEHFNCKLPMELFKQLTTPINNIADDYVENKKYYKCLTDHSKILLSAMYLNAAFTDGDANKRLTEIKQKKYVDVLFGESSAKEFLSALILKFCLPDR